MIIYFSMLYLAMAFHVRLLKSSSVWCCLKESSFGNLYVMKSYILYQPGWYSCRPRDFERKQASNYHKKTLIGIDRSRTRMLLMPKHVSQTSNCKCFNLFRVPRDQNGCVISNLFILWYSTFNCHFKCINAVFWVSYFQYFLKHVCQH